VLWLPLCRKHVVDRDEALRFARRRKVAAFEEAIAVQERREKEKEPEKEKEKETEKEKHKETDEVDLLDELGGGWVMIEKDEAPKLTGKAKEREEMRKVVESKRKAEAEKRPKSLKILPIDKITTKWWDEFTPEEEELEKRRGPYEKPLWKEAFVAWKIARDRQMLHVCIHIQLPDLYANISQRCANCNVYYYQKDNHPKACQYHTGDTEILPTNYGAALESPYSCCGGMKFLFNLLSRLTFCCIRPCLL